MGGCVVPWLRLLAVTVALVLADSAVVTLALPDILQAPAHLRRAGRLGADRVQSRAGARRGTDGPDLRPGATADPQCRRDSGVRRFLGVVRVGGVDRRAGRSSVRAGAWRRVGAGRLPGATGRGVRRAARHRGLGHGWRGRNGHRTGGRRTADAGVLLAGHLRRPGPVCSTGRAGHALRSAPNPPTPDRHRPLCAPT